MTTDKQQIRWIKDQLTNVEMASDDELRDAFIADGLSPEEADRWLAKRSFYENNIVMQDADGSDRGVYNPRTGLVDPLPDNF